MKRTEKKIKVMLEEKKAYDFFGLFDSMNGNFVQRYNICWSEKICESYPQRTQDHQDSRWFERM